MIECYIIPTILVILEAQGLVLPCVLYSGAAACSMDVLLSTNSCENIQLLLDVQLESEAMSKCLWKSSVMVHNTY